MAENQTTIREAVNNVGIEGTVAEVRIETKKSTEGKEMITGEVDIQTDENSTHTVKVFANKLNKEGKESGLYKGIETIMNEYKSIASHGKDGADRVRITQGKIGLNEYVGQDEMLKSFPQLSANFINRLNATEEFEPKAEFEAEMYVHSVTEEVKNEEETGRALLKGFIPVYGGKVIPFTFVVADKDAVDYVSSNYESGSTVTVYGEIVNRVNVSRTEVEVGFGKPQEKVTRTTVREYVVTGGTPPLDEDDVKAYKTEVIKKALVEREAYLEELKTKKKEAAKKFATPEKKGFGNKANEPKTTEP
ncbi:hypothetical protein, partial [Brevibacillus brevis]|uniref:hypothetical protein n=1 Tax=Brevibacillus brevis TaxID=1393 RepID=UPI0012F8318E